MAAYRPMTLVDLAGWLSQQTRDEDRWRLVAEFLEEYRHEPEDVRAALVRDDPPTCGVERWDVFLAALAEHLSLRDSRDPPGWSDRRSLPTFWFPFATRAARADALVHAPVSFRRRGVFVSPQELEVA